MFKDITPLKISHCGSIYTPGTSETIVLCFLGEPLLNTHQHTRAHGTHTHSPPPLSCMHTCNHDPLTYTLTLTQCHSIHAHTHTDTHNARPLSYTHTSSSSPLTPHRWSETTAMPGKEKRAVSSPHPGLPHPPLGRGADSQRRCLCSSLPAPPGGRLPW